MFSQVFGKDTVFANPYWGDLGAKLGWSGQCVPKSGLQAFGGPAGPSERILLGAPPPSADTGAPLLTIARRSQAEFVDLIAIVLAETGTMDPEVYAQSSTEMHQFALTSWTWLPAVTTDADLALQFQAQFRVWRRQQTAEVAVESFGLLGDIGQAINNAAGWTLNAASDQLLLHLKPMLTQYAVKFFGDIFVYLDTGRAAIRRRLLESANDLWNSPHNEDDRLVVVCHSFGGPIFTDMLFDPTPIISKEVKIDLVLTVGSQVGLFWEMDLYSTKLASLGVRPPDKVPVPENVSNWFNVLDLADPLAFRLDPIMDRIQEWVFNTNTSLLNAHTTYFERPSFFDSLHDRISNLKNEDGTPLF